MLKPNYKITKLELQLFLKPSTHSTISKQNQIKKLLYFKFALSHCHVSIKFTAKDCVESLSKQVTFIVFHSHHN